MGAFFITERHNRGVARKTDALQTLFKQGFDHYVELSNARHLVVYCAKIQSQSDNIYQLDVDNFCFSTGTLIYRQLIGKDASRCLFEDMRDRCLDAESLRGSFALVLCLKGALYVHNDPQGLYPIWHNSDLTSISSSFPASMVVAPRLHPNKQAIYEQVFHGRPLGDETVFRQIQRLSAGTGLALRESGRVIPSLVAYAKPAETMGLHDHMDHLQTLLSDQFSDIHQCFADSVSCVFSGGYDARLLLGMCRASDITPRLHVEGDTESPDVLIATDISDELELELVQDDLAESEPLERQAFAQAVLKNFYALQGMGLDGIVDDGFQLKTMRARQTASQVLLDGFGGALLRNDLVLPDRHYRLRDFLWSAYSDFDPATCTERFDQDAYYAAIEQKIQQCLGIDSDRLTRREVEQLQAIWRYGDGLRIRHAVYNQYGYFLTPLADFRVVAASLDIPIRLKNHGFFQAALIKQIDPVLAAHSSSYGYNFRDPVPLSQVLNDWLKLLQPAWLRRYSYQLKAHDRSQWPYFLADEYVQTLLPQGFHYMNSFFRLDQIRDPQQFQRICSLEYLLQTANTEQSY